MDVRVRKTAKGRLGLMNNNLGSFVILAQAAFYYYITMNFIATSLSILNPITWLLFAIASYIFYFLMINCAKR